ncbi:MAG: flagellar hook-basal body protein [Pseudomonadota bacterium]
MTNLIMALGGVIQREMDTLKSVSQNVANANTTGYRATRSFSVFTASMPAQGTASAGIASRLSGIESHQAINSDAGALHFTGRQTDLAISGNAWFVVQTPEGTRLTRDGRFRTDAAGQLVNQAGYPVLSMNGPLVVGNGTFTMDVTGEVRADGQVRGQLKLQRVADVASLSPVGNGLYSANAPLLSAERYVVHQGLEERSNADLAADMVKVMEVSRHIESVQRALSAYDGMLNSGINQLGKE